MIGAVRKTPCRLLCKRKALALVATLGLTAAPYDEASAVDAYVVIDSIVHPLTEKQPTWIALADLRRRRLVHVRAKRSIVGLREGTYRIDHIDFGKEYYDREGTITLKESDALTFSVFRDSITLVGILEIEVAEGANEHLEQDHAVRISRQEDVLSWACDRRKKLFRKMPVLVFKAANDYEPVNVNCVPSSPSE